MLFLQLGDGIVDWQSMPKILLGICSNIAPLVFALDVSATFHFAFPLRGALEFESDGSASAYLQQDTPID